MNKSASFKETKKRVFRHWQMYIYLILPMVYIAIFKYVPMYGLQIAFEV
jgi:putative aldouronate transport system permease protein